MGADQPRIKIKVEIRMFAFGVGAGLPTRVSRQRKNRCIRVSAQASSIRMARDGSSKRVLVPIGTGSEEIEATCMIDTLRRAGAEVVVASVEDKEIVTMSRGTKICSDVLISSKDLGSFDAVALPGGMPGAERLRDCTALIDIIRATLKEKKTVAAICAAPAVVLASHGFLDNVKATCYPADKFRAKLNIVGEGDVVREDPFITATGPGTALKFSLALVSKLYSPETSDQLAKEMLVTV